MILYNSDFNKNFTLTKNDLFAFNSKEENDKNLYFLIVNGIDDQNRWILGIPFLKKYILSFDYDNKRIGYYINYGKEKDEDKNGKGNGISFFESTAFKVIMIIIAAGIIFVLGMIFSNYLKKTRKKRANELDDNFEYEAYYDKNSNDEEKNKIINDE